MRLFKHELSSALAKVKGIVKKNDAFPALGSVLIADGYLTASDMSITIKIRLPGSETEKLLLPEKAFGLIRNLPDGEVELKSDGKTLTISMEGIRNRFQMGDPEDFSFDREIPPYSDAIRMPGQQLMKILSDVVDAASDETTTKTSAVCIQTSAEGLNAVALDGRRIAWNWIADQLKQSLELLVPKATIARIISMGITDDVYVTYDKANAIFMTDNYVVYSRLLDGKFFGYRKMFESRESTEEIEVGREAFLKALTRAKSCVEDKTPTILRISGDEMQMECSSTTSYYSETLPLTNIAVGSLAIAFDGSMLAEALKPFSAETVRLSFGGAKAPMVISAERTHLQALVLPVLARTDTGKPAE